MTDAERVLVTGASGYLGVACIAALLNAGHPVRGTVRSLARTDQVHAMVRAAGADPARLELVEADLLGDGGWADAVAGCPLVLHVASPFPARSPKDPNELITPAVDGTLRVLRAAHAAGARRVVLTSSFAAIGYGHRAARRAPFTEADWSNPDGLAAYPKSKLLAERAAWDYVSGPGKGLELTVINPVGILGPVFGPDLSSSIELVRGMINGSAPAVPQVTFGVVDVRDVADLHVLALAAPQAAGQRYLATAGDFLTLVRIGRILHDGLGDAGRKAPTREIPNWLARLAARVVPELRPQLPNIGLPRNGTSAKAREQLGWRPRPPVEVVLTTGRSLVAAGLAGGKSA